MQGQIKDLEKNLILNKDILNRLLLGSGTPDDVNAQLLAVIRELQSKVSALEQQVAVSSLEKEQLQTFAS